MPRKTIKTQLELFPETRSTAATPIPPWQSLPADTRQALTRLMARLMTEHASAVGGEGVDTLTRPLARWPVLVLE
ncbi:hypothetical protein [Roseovarius sp.]|uniref:hypothetical protein n=1 Tax=Roseovarius sp. TaxID=1486281 RepID=UPI003BAD19DB